MKRGKKEECFDFCVSFSQRSEVKGEHGISASVRQYLLEQHMTISKKILSRFIDLRPVQAAGQIWLP